MNDLRINAILVKLYALQRGGWSYDSQIAEPTNSAAGMSNSATGFVAIVEALTHRPQQGKSNDLCKAFLANPSGT